MHNRPIARAILFAFSITAGATAEQSGLANLVKGHAQVAPGPQPAAEILTNETILRLVKAGLGEETIILAIGQQPARFDVSPQALIDLKKAGATDRVLNAMLSAPKAAGSFSPAVAGSSSPSRLLDKALNALGPREKLTSIQAARLVGKSTQTRAGGAAVSSELERVTCYPDRLYVESRLLTGLTTKLVLTAEFNYFVSGKMTSAVPAADLETIRTSLRFDPAYVAQHTVDFTLSYDGSEDIGTESCDKLRIRNREGKEVVWSIDRAGRIRRITGQGSSGEVVTDLSDYRVIDGVNVPFERHAVENGRTTDLVLSHYEINPAIDSAWFTPPAEQPATGLRIKVLQEQSVPYVVQSGGGISTTCNIAGSANTSMTATTTGNFTFGNATTNLGMTMNCKSYDTTVRWQHVLNAMFVEGSDGNAYIIACDRAWRWSKCVPLRAGEVFNASQTSKGMDVHWFNTKGRESETTYYILQSKSLR